MPNFTKKHYKIISSLLKDEYDNYERMSNNENASTEQRLLNESRKSAMIRLISRFSEVFTKDNPLFEYDKFIKACLGK
ncbi:MAG: hypothetical protein ACYDBX_02360 [Patescibacteria group bacterium]